MNDGPAPKLGTVISAMFLVGGTCIGGGMLALPVATGISGFFPSILTMFLCWLAMTLTALLLLEVSLWMEEGVHIITMTSRILGLPGKAIAWLMYLFISYASIIAYTAGGGGEISSVMGISRELGCILFIVVFGSVIYFGSKIVGRVNAILFVAMIAAYVLLVGMGLDEVKLHLLKYKQWSTSLMAIPLLLTAFSFQTMVPSLTPYLKRHASSLRLAVFGGTGLAFIVYAVWEWLVLGIVPPDGPTGLIEALIQGSTPTQFIGQHVQNSYFASVAQFFAFFALVTSFFGMALGLFDFLADGLKIPENRWGGVILALLIAIPTLFFSIYYERIFLIALETTGGYGDAILNGIIPALMVWVGRYKLGYKSDFTVPGGKPMLALIMIFFASVIMLEILMNFGWLPSILTIQ